MIGLYRDGVLLVAAIVCIPGIAAGNSEEAPAPLDPVASSAVPLPYYDPADPMLHGDPTRADGRPAPIVPGAPSLHPGPDAEYGTDDDLIGAHGEGDIDLRVQTFRAGDRPVRIHPETGRAVPLATAEPFGEGKGILFGAVPSDGSHAAPGGNPVASPSLEGNMLLGAIFGDLDGDGYIGITHLDGDDSDSSIERFELEPLGRRLAFVRPGGAYAIGEVHASVGGPTGAELDVVVAGLAVTGDLDPARPDDFLPDGTLVMTRLPFHPNLDHGYTNGGRPGPSGLFALELEVGFEPDPSDPVVGERFTLATDDLDPTVGAAMARSGTFARFGLARPVESASRLSRSARLRPGLLPSGERALFEVTESILVPDDGDASSEWVSLVPLDRLGNIADLEGWQAVYLEAQGGVEILSPDIDGVPNSELIFFLGSEGVEVEIDDAGASGDSGSEARLLIASSRALTRVPLRLRTIDPALLQAIRDTKGKKERDRGYDPWLDLNGDHRIDSTDEWIAEDRLSGTP